MSRVTQVRKPEPPAGPLREVAVLGWSPQEFRDKRGIEFSRGVDDLDAFEWAWLDVDGCPVFLLRYVRSPDPGTELLSPVTADPHLTIEHVLSALDLPADTVTWRTDVPVVEQPLLIEPANPFDIPRDRLEELVEELSHLGLAARPQLHLRHEVGYGVQGWQAVRLWLPADLPQAVVRELIDIASHWLKRLWDVDPAKRDARRTRSLVVYDRAGIPLGAVRVSGKSGDVVFDDEPEQDYPLPPPTASGQ
jgi:hypothetical protein